MQKQKIDTKRFNVLIKCLLTLKAEKYMTFHLAFNILLGKNK